VLHTFLMFVNKSRLYCRK